MAQITRVHGDAFPVLNLDINNGNESGTLTPSTATPFPGLVQPQGPKLDYFAVVVKNAAGTAQSLVGQDGTLQAVEAINFAIQQIATIYIYQVQADTSGQISYALYDTGAYTAASLEAAIQALGTSVGSGSIDVSGSTVTNVGFKLALA